MFYIYSGRFQPLHNGHVSMINSIINRHPKDYLIVCIIKEETEKMTIAPSDNMFYQEAIKKHLPHMNPIPNWNRYMMLKQLIDSDPFYKNVILFFRKRSEVDWFQSIEDLPPERTFMFPSISKEKFDQEKITFYMGKQEKIELVDADNLSLDISAQQIRDNINDRELIKKLIPTACYEYFIKECLKYFLK